MTRQRLIAVSLLLLLLVVAAFWYFSPYVTLHAMRSAAQAHDAEALAQHVDFPRVRESMKQQLRTATERKVQEAGGGGNELAKAGAAFGAMLGNFMADKLVDAVVSPEALASAMREGKMPGPVAGPPQESDARTEPAGQEKPWTFERDGVNVFVARSPGDTAKPKIGFVLEREGFATWKLVRVEMPALR